MRRLVGGVLLWSVAGCGGIPTDVDKPPLVQARFFGDLVFPGDVTWRSAQVLPTLEDCATGRPRSGAFEFWTVSGLRDDDHFQAFSEGHAPEGTGCVYFWLQVERGGVRASDSVLVGPLEFVRPPVRDSLELRIEWEGDSARVSLTRRWPAAAPSLRSSSLSGVRSGAPSPGLPSRVPRTRPTSAPRWRRPCRRDRRRPSRAAA